MYPVNYFVDVLRVSKTDHCLDQEPYVEFTALWFNQITLKALVLTFFRYFLLFLTHL